jgi:hypothetical protein
MRSRRSIAIALAATLAAVAALASCASQQPSSHARFERIDANKQAIHDLWMQIREWRFEAGLRGVEPPFELKLRMSQVPLRSLRDVCPDDTADADPVPEICTDVCNIADAICDNADAICRIADELEGDTWAADKCRSAKASCKEAKQRCCQCKSKPA